MLLSEYQAHLADIIDRYARNAVHKPALLYSCHKHLPDGLIIESSVPEFEMLMDEALERFVP